MKRKDVRKALKKTYESINEECENGGFDGIVIINKYTKKAYTLTNECLDIFMATIVVVGSLLDDTCDLTIDEAAEVLPTAVTALVYDSDIDELFDELMQDE